MSLQPNLMTLEALQVIERLRKRLIALQIKRLKRPLNGKPRLKIVFRGQKASDLIREQLNQSKPCFIGRLGRLEKEAITRYQNSIYPISGWKKFSRYLFQQSGPYWWDDDFRFKMVNNAGFFPPENDQLVRFAKQMMIFLESVDILGVFGDEGQLVNPFKKIQPIPFSDLEPYFHQDPWTIALKGKKVLVIHPFEQSIRSQYCRRQNLFDNPDILPEFELITLKAVQSIANTPVSFSSWFEALNWMCRQMEQISFDVAIIGAGAYGFPLAAYAKQIGKKAVHLGGATQILFGIRGKRWDRWQNYKDLYNDSWIHPLPEETPKNSYVVEEGCYW